MDYDYVFEPRRSDRKRKQTQFFTFGKEDINKKNRKSGGEESDEKQESSNDEIAVGIGIESLPNELLARIFQTMDFRDRLRAEGVSKRWNRLLKEESWRYNTDIQLYKNIDSKRVLTLFRRCGRNLRELVIRPYSPQEAHLHLDWYSIEPIIKWIRMVPALDALHISHRELRELHVHRMAAHLKLSCLHLEDCFGNGMHFDCLLHSLGNCISSLRFLSIRSFHSEFSMAQWPRILPSQLKHLELDDGLPIEMTLHLVARDCAHLSGLSLSYMRLTNVLFQFRFPRDMFKRLQLFDIYFLRDPNEAVLKTLKKVIKVLTNVRILSLNRINGEILETITQHCGQLEQLEYLSHHASILDAFPQICRLKKLRVLIIRHYNEANPNDSPKQLFDTLAKLAGQDQDDAADKSKAKTTRPKLEYLSVNFKLPMDLVLQIVRGFPTLSYLEYAQSPGNLLQVVEAVNEQRSQGKRTVPLRFRISAQKWKKYQKAAVYKLEERPTGWFIPIDVPEEETEVIKEHLGRVFEGGRIPEFLCRANKQVDYDDWDEEMGNDD